MRAKRALRDVLVGPLSLKQVVVLCRELKATTDSGIPMVRALLIIAEHAGGIRLRRLLKHMAEQIRHGASFSDAVEWHRGRFPSFFREMVRSGEASGKLAMAFEYLAEHYENNLKLRQAVMSAAAYWIAVGLAMGLIPAMQAYLARFANVDMGDPAELLLGYLKHLAILVAEIWLVIRLRIPQALWRLFGGHLPFLARIARGLSLARFFQCLAMLLEAGLSVPRSIEHAARVAGNIPLSLGLMPAADRIRKGATLTEALSDAPFFGQDIRAMLKVGEDSGKLDPMLRKIAKYSQDDAMYRLRTLILCLEGILVFALGLAIIL